MFQLFSYCLVPAIFAACVFFQDLKAPQIPKKFLRPPDNIKYFTLGYNDMVASLLWLRVMQDIDRCENGKVVEEDYVAPIKEAPSKIQGIVQRNIKPSKCHKGWVYSMLEAITEIQPKFKIAYDVGASFLSITVDDREGARLIYDKGLKQYPNDWRLNFSASYLYLWELQDADRAAELMHAAIKNGGPPLLSTLVAAIYSESGRLDIANIALRQALSRDPPEDIKKAILQKLELINKNSKSP